MRKECRAAILQGNRETSNLHRLLDHGSRHEVANRGKVALNGFLKLLASLPAGFTLGNAPRKRLAHGHKAASLTGPDVNAHLHFKALFIGRRPRTKAGARPQDM